MQICAWKTSSTNKETGKPDLPEKCKERNCTGMFKKCEPIRENCPCKEKKCEPKCAEFMEVER